MENISKKDMETALKKLTKQYKTETDTTKRIMLIKEITLLNKIISEEEINKNKILHNNYDENFNKEKLEFEKVKFNEELKTNKSKEELEKEKLEFEKIKFYEEIKSRKAEKKSERKNKIIDTGIKIAGIVIPATLYFGGMLLSLKLEYVDNGVTPSAMKDFLKRLK